MMASCTWNLEVTMRRRFRQSYPQTHLRVQVRVALFAWVMDNFMRGCLYYDVATGDGLLGSGATLQNADDGTPGT